MKWMKSIRIALLVLILSLIAVPVAVCEESECSDVTLVWGERVTIGGYEFEVTDFSAGNMSQIMVPVRTHSISVARGHTPRTVPTGYG